MWKGVIIGESLENKGLLSSVDIVGTKKSFLEGEKEKGVFHLHKILVGDSEKPSFVTDASNTIKQGFYIHICQGDGMTVIFKNKVFEFSAQDNEKIKDAKNYGESIGIPKIQMDFEYLLHNPWD